MREKNDGRKKKERARRLIKAVIGTRSPKKRTKREQGQLAGEVLSRYNGIKRKRKKEPQ